MTSLYEGADYPLPYTLPLFDVRAVQAGALEIVATRGVGSMPTSPALPRKRDEPEFALASAAATAREMADLQAEVSTLRAHATQLQRQKDLMYVQLRTEQRIRGNAPMDTRPAGLPSTSSGPPTQDWRLDGAEYLSRTLNLLQRRNRGSELAAVVKHSVVELASLARDEAPDTARGAPPTLV